MSKDWCDTLHKEHVMLGAKLKYSHRLGQICLHITALISSFSFLHMSVHLLDSLQGYEQILIKFVWSGRAWPKE